MFTQRMRRLSFIAVVLMLFSLGGCDFKTTVISDADSPERITTRFFDSLKQRDFDQCDSMLADNATIRVTADSEGRFVEALTDLYLDNLSFELAGNAKTEGLTATQSVRITTADKSALMDWLSQNKNKVEKKYLKANHLDSLDHQDPNSVDDMLVYALQLYADNVQLTTTDVVLTLFLTGDEWKIEGSQALAQAIYGGGNQNEK